MKKIVALLCLILIAIQVNAQTETITLPKAGKLKSLLKKKENVQVLSISGTMNNKDL